MATSRIAIFVPTLNGGGAERIMVTLANAFAARAYEVDLVLASAKGPYLADVARTVRVVDLKAGRVFRALWPLRRYLRKEQPKAMLSALGHANVVALLARRVARVRTRLVVSEHGTVSGEYQIAQGFVAKTVFKLMPWLYRWADGICTVSNAASADLARFVRLPPARIATIYNPFDLERMDRLASEPLDHPWLAPGQPPVIVAAGRLNEAKSFDVLIRAFAHLRQGRAARLVILGEGELRTLLEAQVEASELTGDDVQMPGFKNNPYAWFARCALFVLSSHREGLPGALIEAMACGAPVVSTDCRSGPAEILEGGRWGCLVPVGDERALTRAMGEVLDTPQDQLPDVRLRARDFAQERAVDAYLNLLLERS